MVYPGKREITGSYVRCGRMENNPCRGFMSVYSDL